MIDYLPYFFLKDGQPYRFEAVMNNDLIVVNLPAGEFDDLKWKEQIDQISEAQKANKKVMIHLELGLENSILLDQEKDFSRYLLAVDQLNTKIIQPFHEILQSIVLYKGTVFVENSIEWEEDDLKEHCPVIYQAIFAKQIQKRIAGMGVLGSLLHRLVAFLDERVMPLAVFDDADLLKPFEKAILFSKERFDHIFVVIENKDFQFTTLDLGSGLSTLGYLSNQNQSMNEDVRLGLLMPSDTSLNQEAYDLFVKTMDKLKEKSLSYRIVCEKIFNDCWNDLDEVIYNSSCIHPMTLRMVRGFEASGGLAHKQEEWLQSL